jgi:hypothetical protein
MAFIRNNAWLFALQMSAYDPKRTSRAGLPPLAANALVISSLGDCDLATMLLPEGLPISCQTAYR